VDFRKSRRLSKNDGLFVWTKGCQQSEILSPVEWDLLPAQITVRVLRFTTLIRGFRNRRITLVTTLLDPKLYPGNELVALYARRWRLELCLRDLKTTMGMEQLRCKTPDMAEKELLAYLVAHNLVRCVMAEAAAAHPGRVGTGKLQGKCGCAAPIQRRHRAGFQPQAASPTMETPAADPRARFGPLPTASNRTSSRQTPAQALSSAQ
jgi:hypothetical protein